jgi:hypothetical protein
MTSSEVTGLNELSIDGFRHAIRATHGSECQFVGQRVHESFEGETVWEGEVLIFDLLGNQLATRCYAWEVDGRVTAVLHTGPINSPLRAVQASIMADEPTAG